MEVGKHLHARQSPELFEVERQQTIDQPEYSELPGGGVDARGSRGIQHRPLAGARLSWRNALRAQSVRADDDARRDVRGAERLAGLVFGFEMVHEGIIDRETERKREGRESRSTSLPLSFS